MKRHQLIGAQVSLYTGKLRCYLDYKAIPYDEIVASTEVYREVIIPRTGVQYIPVLISDDDVAVQDTTEIIDFLEARYPLAPIYPATPKQKLVALLLEIYGDEWLVLPAMHYRWNIPENTEFARQEFGRTSAPDATPEAQYAIGLKTSAPFAGSLPKLGITELTIPAIETSYLALLGELDAHFAQHPLLLGSRPSIGDFGLIGPLYAHLYRDPASGRLMEQHAPNVVAWIKRMIKPTALSGEFLPNDEVPDTLLPILQRMFREQGSVLKQTIDQVKSWADQNEGPEILRAIGKAGFEIEGVQGERLTFPYMQWMWQRAADFYQELDKVSCQEVDEMLKAIPGACELLVHPITRRVERVGNRLMLALMN